MPAPFVAKRGGLEMRIGEPEAEILSQIVSEMRAQLSSPDRPEHLRRLFPSAYPDDRDAADEFARLTFDDLTAAKLQALDEVDAVLRRGKARRDVWSVTLEHDEVHSLLGVLNDARLALGTRLNVSEEMDEDTVGEDDPNHFAYAVYRYLGWLQTFLLDELM